MIDFIIDIFIKWFSEGFAMKLFSPLYRFVDKKWPNNKIIRMVLTIILIVITCATGIAVAFGIVLVVAFVIYNSTK